MIRCVFWEWLCHISVTVKFLSDSLTLHIIFNPHAVSSPATLISPCSWRALVSGEGCWTKLLVSIGLLLLLLVSSVLYLPAAAAGCLRECGGVRRGDSPRSGGVGLGLLGLCCCLKNGLSKRPCRSTGEEEEEEEGGRHTTTHEDSNAPTWNRRRDEATQQDREDGREDKTDRREFSPTGRQSEAEKDCGKESRGNPVKKKERDMEEVEDRVNK